jgi:hypothetical protein
MDGIWMHEGDLEPEHAAPGLRVDQLRTRFGQIRDRKPHVVDLVGDMVHPGPPLREEASHRRIVAQGGEQLDSALADPHRRRLDTLLLDALAMLESAAEQTLVRRDRLVEVRNRDAYMMDTPCLHEDDVTVAPLTRRLLIGLLVLAPVAAGCGGGSKSNGEAAKPAGQVLLDAKESALGAKAVHVSGSITEAGKPITLDLTLVKGVGGQGAMSESKLTFDIVRIGDTAYIRGSDAFLRRFAGAAGALLLRGKWLQGSATRGELAALAPLTDIAKLFNGALGSHGKLRNEGETTYKGQKAVAITDSTRGGTLYLAADGPPYPLAIVGKDRGAVVFDNWGEPAAIEAPKGAIDLGKLGTG